MFPSELERRSLPTLSMELVQSQGFVESLWGYNIDECIKLKGYLWKLQQEVPWNSAWILPWPRHIMGPFPVLNIKLIQASPKLEAGIAHSLQWLGCGLDGLDWNLERGKNFCLHKSWPALGPTQSIIRCVLWETKALSPRVKRPEREVDQTHASSAETKNDWRYTSVTLYAFMPRTVTNLTLLSPFSKLWHACTVGLYLFYPHPIK